jgi:hypothetical protein
MFSSQAKEALLAVLVPAGRIRWGMTCGQPSVWGTLRIATSWLGASTGWADLGMSTHHRGLREFPLSRQTLSCRTLRNSLDAIAY